MKTKERFMMYVKIAERAEDLGIYDGKRSTLLMDIESADEYFNMRMEDWLNADNFNFAHDVVGIVQNADRSKFPAEFSRFLPRFAGK